MKIKFIFIIIYSFFSIILGVFLMFFFKNRTHFFRKIWASSIIKILGVEIEEKGRLNKDADMIVLNHNSILDFIILDYLHPKEISWVAKDTLSKIPIF
jgi:1-acyl-sn-glycerol-3-phosphate acyltransferase